MLTFCYNINYVPTQGDVRMNDIRSQQRQKQNDLHILKERMKHEQPDYIELIFGEALDRITVSFSLEDTVKIDGSPEDAAMLVSQAAFASYESALRAFRDRNGGEHGKRYSAEYQVAQLVGYNSPRVPDKDNEWFDF